MKWWPIKLGLLTWYSNIHCSIESCRFWDEDDYEHRVFLLLSSALVWASVSLAGKRNSRRHSNTSFSENVVVAGKSYQILEVWSFCDRERVKPSPMKITALIFQVKNSTMKLSRLNIFRQNAKKLVLVVVFVIKSKALWLMYVTLNAWSNSHTILTKVVRC